MTLGEFIGSTERDVVPLGPAVDSAAGQVSVGAFTSGAAAGAKGKGVLVTVACTAMRAGQGPLALADVVLSDTKAAMPSRRQQSMARSPSRGMLSSRPRRPCRPPPTTAPATPTATAVLVAPTDTPAAAVATPGPGTPTPTATCDPWAGDTGSGGECDRRGARNPDVRGGDADGSGLAHGRGAMDADADRHRDPRSDCDRSTRTAATAARADATAAAGSLDRGRHLPAATSEPVATPTPEASAAGSSAGLGIGLGVVAVALGAGGVYLWRRGRQKSS